MNTNIMSLELKTETKEMKEEIGNGLLAEGTTGRGLYVIL